MKKKWVFWSVVLLVIHLFVIKIMINDFDHKQLVSYSAERNEAYSDHVSGNKAGRFQISEMELELEEFGNKEKCCGELILVLEDEIFTTSVEGNMYSVEGAKGYVGTFEGTAEDDAVKVMIDMYYVSSKENFTGITVTYYGTTNITFFGDYTENISHLVKSIEEQGKKE